MLQIGIDLGIGTGWSEMAWIDYDGIVRTFEVENDGDTYSSVVFINESQLNEGDMPINQEKTDESNEKRLTE